jgi:hypothetical protein
MAARAPAAEIHFEGICIIPAPLFRSTGAIKNYVPQAFHGSNDQASQRTPIAGRNPDKAGMCGKAECCRSVDSGEEGETEGPGQAQQTDSKSKSSAISGSG